MCSYCDRPHYEINLPCIKAEITNYPKNSQDGEWVEVIFEYECPKCGTIWTGERYCHSS